MRFQENAIFKKRPKIDRKSIRVRISSQSSDDFAFFPLSEATWDRICSLQGGSGLSWAPFLGPRRILEASWASPERPWDAPGAPRGRSETLPGRLWSGLGASRSILGAPGASRERFLVDFGIDFGCIFGLLRQKNRKRIRADFCEWWTNYKDRLTVRLARWLSRRTA